ncbi:MAG: UbiA family prenyltransferase, partial [Verrucomicrobia bacterium]|nr:UbiA family prenyltransferase [Verrucomicrobiota bacterium]
ACLLAGGTLVESADMQRFAWLIAGATLLFLAGMFLNDAFDVQFDREHRPERPIPSGAISVKAVWVLGIGQLLLGLGCLVWMNTLAALCVLGLAASILLYDWLHKRTAWSPMIMGLCRLFLYLLAAATTTGSLDLTVVLCAFALWAYIVGLSNIARREATGGRVNSWPCWLLGLPLALTFALPYWDGDSDVSWRGVVVAAALYALWTVRSLLFTFKSMMPQHGRTVSGLLAGIVLFDFLLAANQNMQMGVVFFGLFGLALLFQRYIPAT